MRFRLALAMSRHAGTILTQDVARRILDEVCSGADAPIDLAQFAPVRWSGYTIAAERFLTQEPALIALEHAFRREVGLGGQFHGAAQAARLREEEAAGLLLVLVARTAAGDVAGLMRVRVGGHVATQTLRAWDELLYVVPGHRGWLGYHLARYAERCAFQLGARDFTLTCQASTGSGRLARYAGYRPVATIFKKVAQDACDISQMPTRHQQGVAHVPLASH